MVAEQAGKMEIIKEEFLSLGLLGVIVSSDDWPKLMDGKACEKILLYQLPSVGDGRPKIREALGASRSFPRKVILPGTKNFVPNLSRIRL